MCVPSPKLSAAICPRGGTSVCQTCRSLGDHLELTLPVPMSMMLGAKLVQCKCCGGVLVRGNVLVHWAYAAGLDSATTAHRCCVQ